jgi:3-oxoacyl-[acyl-carrier protein] reductase
MELGIRGRAAVVAGASKGMGRATVLRLLEEGADVAFCARSGDVLEEIRGEAEARRLPGRPLPVRCDLAARGGADAFVRQAAEAFGRLDIMMFAPSIHLNRPFADITDDEWEETFNITFHAGARMARAVIPHMRARHWGRMLFLGAGSIYKHGVGPKVEPVDVHPDFTAAKAALTSLAKFLSKDLGPDQILVNTLHPGYVLGPEKRARLMGGNAGPIDAPHEGFIAQAARFGYIPAVGHPGTPEGFAKLAVFLCSEANEFVSGVEVAVDGGGLDVG